MPKLNNRPPKYSKMGKYAVVYYGGKSYYLGRYGSDESKVAYSRLLAEIQASPTGVPLPKEEQHVTVRELAAAFLDYSQSSINPTDYAHYRTVVLDFLDKLYGDDTPVEQFKPSCLKLVRQEMMKSRRFCRNIINKYIKFTVANFGWGVEHNLVPDNVESVKNSESIAKRA